MAFNMFYVRLAVSAVLYLSVLNIESFVNILSEKLEQSIVLICESIAGDM